MKNIVISGSVAYDYLMTFPGYFKEHFLTDHLDTISLSFLVDTMVKQRGGCAANIAYGLSRFRIKPKLMASVGQDFGDYRHWLESEGIDTSAIHIVEDKFTASFFANTDKANSQICSFYTGAMANAVEQSISELSPKPDLFVISPNDPQAMVKFCIQCADLGIPYLYDPSQQLPRLNGDELKLGIRSAWALFVNEYEFSLIQEKTSLSAQDIINQVPLVLVTLGEKGSLIYHKGHINEIPVFPVKTIADPTGVGDAFRGGFLAGYSLQLDYITCAQMGALSAAYCLEQCGTQSYNFTIEEFIQRFRQHYDDQGKLDGLVALK